MRSPVQRWNAIEKSDRAFMIGSIIAPLAIWWFYFGREKYSTKGIK